MAIAYGIGSDSTRNKVVRVGHHCTEDECDDECSVHRISVVRTALVERRIKACFVSHSAYAAMRGEANGHIGGIERQQALMAKWLVARGHAVSMLTWDEGGPVEEMIDGVRVIKVCRQCAGLPGLRFFHPKWTSLSRAMREADAEVYYQNCGECFTGQVAMWCRRHGKRFVYSVANDTDCDPRLATMATLRERWLYRYGLLRADQIVVQTQLQKVMLERGFGRESLMLPMPSEGAAECLAGDCVERTGRVLWLARVCPQKRPDRLLDVARTCPEIEFDMVGPSGTESYAQEVVTGAQAIGNIRVQGPVAFGEVGKHYRQAVLLLCTSDYEGFPNTFLEAWSCGVPVVSTFDPDGLIAREGLGVAASDVLGLAAGLRRLLNDADLYQRCSENARRYFLANHAIEKAMPRFEKVFVDVCHRTSAGRDEGSDRYVRRLHVS